MEATARHSESAAVRARGNRIRLASRAAIYGAALLVSGCAVIGVASTAATLAVGVVSTVVDVGVGAVKITGKVIGKGIDVATGPGTPAPAEAVNASRPSVN